MYAEGLEKKSIRRSSLTQSGGPSAFKRNLLLVGHPFGGIVTGLCQHPSCCFGERGLDLLSSLQTTSQPRCKGHEESANFFLFLHGVVMRRLTASVFLRFLVAISRVYTCKIVAAPIAVMEFQGVHLGLLAVAPKSCPLAELHIRAELALDGPHPSTLPFGLGCQEHQSMPLRQRSRDLAEVLPIFGVLLNDNLLRRRAPDVAPYIHLHALLNPRRLFLYKETHRPLRDTKSQHGLMVCSLCCRGLEPLCSVSHCLGNTIDLCLGPRDGGSTSPLSGRRLPWDPSRTRPAPLLRAGGSIFVAICPCRQLAIIITVSPIPSVTLLPEGSQCLKRDCRGRRFC